MNIKELREKKEGELKDLLTGFRNKLTKMKFDISAKQLKNHREIRKIKKETARILTILSEKSAKPKKGV